MSHSEAQQPEIIPSYIGYTAHYRTNSLSADLSADTGVGLIQATAYGNWNSQQIVPPFAAATSFNLGSKLYVARLSDIFKVESDNTFRISAEYRHDDMATTSLNVGHVFYDVVSAAAMWSWASSPT